ncbi:MAG: hypothetical protein PHH13_04155 [Candidatus Peribacteraceae bacterium]|nr:hypothetical protein [Candidatus Peribacteraceae bacterium]
MSLFKRRVTAKEFADGLWISVSHATKSFTKLYWSDFEKRNGFKLPPETSFENFAVEALLLHLWIAGKALGIRRQRSLDLLTKDISEFLLLKLSVDNPESLIMQHFKQYHGLMDKKDMQELGCQICENLYGGQFLARNPRAFLSLPLALVSYIPHMTDAFLKIENEFKIID